MATGEEVHEDADGRRKQINADGSVLVAEAPPTPPPQSIGDGVGACQVDPKELSAESKTEAGRRAKENAAVAEAARRVKEAVAAIAEAKSLSLIHL